MRKSMTVSWKLVTCILAGVLAFPVLAQGPGGPGGPPGGGRRGGPGGPPGGGRRWDPEQFRQRMLEGIKNQIGASDEEWTVLAPKVEKVWQLSMGGGGGPMGGMRRMWRRRGPEGNRPPGAPEPTAVDKATDDLLDALEDDNTTPETLTEKLAALRIARETAAKELEEARDDLRQFLTVRQEAQLVAMGILE